LREDARMDDQRMATALAVGRIAIGSALLAAPVLAGRGWIGDTVERPGAQAVMRGFGARDVAIGAGLLAAVRGGAPTRPWLLAGMLADAADAVATLAVRDRLPGSAAGVLALATTAGALNGLLAARAG
jgi:hypothetical protein